MPLRKRSRPNQVGQKEANGIGEAQNVTHSPSHPDGERAFRCHFCAKAFQRKEHLQRHERLHTKEKPFQCTICVAGFARRDLLGRHLRLSHVNDDPLPREAEADLARQGDNPSRAGTSLDNASPSEPRTQYEESHLSGLTPTTNEELSSAVPSGPIDLGADPDQRPSAMPPLVSPPTTLDIPPAQHTNSFGDFDSFIDSLNGTHDGGILSFYADQYIFPSSATPLFPTFEPRDLQSSIPNPSGSTGKHMSERPLFDEFTSTLPSFDPSQSTKIKKEPWKVTQQEWDCLLSEVRQFGLIIPQEFLLPSRHTMTRYITTYFAGFHRHLPFIHFPTYSIANCPAELLLAIATIGAISAFDTHNAIMLFRTALAISKERVRQRKEEQHNMIFLAETEPRERVQRFSPLPLAQALLILMAMATWGNSEAIFDEAIGIQNILVNFVRAEKLLDSQTSDDSTWDIWIEEEGFRRTMAIVFCFLIFHTIVYDIPPPILNSEVNICLPSREKDWEAQTEEEWQEARSKHGPEPRFQSMWTSLFLPQTPEAPEHCSSLGGYTMILALIQHIYFLRMAAKHRSEGEQGISSADMTEVERALRNWQSGWNQDPESFLGPGSPLGPISFNSTALLRMAYIRLNVDLGPWRALNTHLPQEIAMSIYRSPPLVTSRRLTRAVLYSAHALSIPVKIGVNIVTHNQAFSWSLQHSLCALECAFIISKWLIAIQGHVSDGSVEEEDARLYAYIVDMVTEAEAGGAMRPPSTDLCSRVVRIWANILSGTAHWNVVRMIGQILDAYAQILETRLA